jgi:hypothetical protein
VNVKEHVAQLHAAVAIRSRVFFAAKAAEQTASDDEFGALLRAYHVANDRVLQLRGGK